MIELADLGYSMGRISNFTKIPYTTLQNMRYGHHPRYYVGKTVIDLLNRLKTEN